MDLQDAPESVLDLNYGTWLPTDRSAAILDLGCGDGRLLRFLAAKGFLDVHGVDRDGAALSRIGILPGVKVECAEVGLDFLRRQRGRFKLIILKQMIYYIERSEVLPFMQALNEALTDDGILVVEFFNAALLSSRLTELKDPFIRTAYTEHSMRRLFLAAGLENIYMGGERRERVTKMRSRIYAALRGCWVLILKTIYILERGIDSELPKIYTKSIIAVASKRANCGSGVLRSNAS